MGIVNFSEEMKQFQDFNDAVASEQSPPFVQLLNSLSPHVCDEEMRKKFPDAVLPSLRPGRFILTDPGDQDYLAILGTSFDAFCVAWRPYGYLKDGSDLTLESYDYNSPGFQKIRELESQRGKRGTLRPAWGRQCLLYVPNEEKWCTFFMKGKGGGRRSSDKLKNLMAAGELCFTFTGQFSNGRYSYYFPTVTVASEEYDSPDPEIARANFEVFMKRQARTTASEETSSDKVR